MTLKRRVTNAGSPEGPGRTQKRRRVSTYVPDTNESPKAIKEAALPLLDQIKTASDKHGRLIAEEFNELPNPKEHPDYYKTIRLPISLETIEKRLKKHEYTCMTSVESDLRRMVSNAKFYNEKASLVFSNAERIRKMVVAEMPKINPAYKDPNYAPFSTPVPGDEEDESVVPPEDANAEPEPMEESPSRPQTANRPSTSGGDTEAQGNAEDSFDGMTFEAAQEKILSEMIRMKDDDGIEVFLPFINKPDRTLYKEYYDIIQHPVSLRSILRAVRGTDRRKSSAQKNPFKTWQEFEEEVSYVWNNARYFNEEGSDIYDLSGDLEEYFGKRLAEARKVVPEPPQANEDAAPAKIKLKMSNTKSSDPSAQKIKLKLPGRSGETRNGVTVDNDALRRQQEVVRAGTNGTEAPPRPTPTRSLRDRSGSGVRPASSSSRRESQQGPSGPSPLPDDVKTERSTRQTPNLDSTSTQGDANGNSSSTAPSLLQGAAEFAAAGDAQSAPISETEDATPQAESVPETRPPKGIRDVRHALIRNVDISTSPALNLQHNFHLDVPPSSKSLVQAITINLPSAHHMLSLTPTQAASSLQRQTQLSVSIGMQKIAPAPMAPVRGVDTSSQRYDIRLGTGITRIDVEVIAAPARGLTHLSLLRGPDVECERVTIFAHLMRP